MAFRRSRVRSASAPPIKKSVSSLVSKGFDTRAVDLKMATVEQIELGNYLRLEHTCCVLVAHRGTLKFPNPKRCG